VLPAIERAFRPEFLNRLDDIILFHALTLREARRILEMQLARIQARLESQRMRLTVTERAQDLIISHGFNEEYGARSLRREAQARVEDVLAEALLTGQAQPGDEVLIDVGAAPDSVVVQVATGAGRQLLPG